MTCEALMQTVLSFAKRPTWKGDLDGMKEREELFYQKFLPLAPRTCAVLSLVIVGLIALHSRLLLAEPLALDTNPPKHNPLLIQPYVYGFAPAKTKRSERMQFAAALLHDFRAIDSAVASLSPNQRDWINKEYFGALKASENRYSQKIFDAMDTLEFATFVVKELWLYNLLPMLEWLSSDKRLDYSVSSEMTYWFYLPKKFTYAQQFQNSLQQLVRRNTFLKQILDNQSINKNLDLYAGNLALQSGLIQETIIEPYMRGALSE
jgi:hypothetical protein